MGHMSLPPGFRFHPTDDELVGYYLKRRVDGLAIELEVIPVIDLYKFDPWQLPEKSFLPMRDMEWFFFCPRDKKYPNGSRTNRATASGYWKATGKDRKVYCESSVQGLRKTLVFHRGRAPGGERTDWVMHEYRLCEDLSQATPNFLGAFALCRVVKRGELVQTKGKRSLVPCAAASEFSPGKNHSRKAVGSSEEYSSPPAAASLSTPVSSSSPSSSESGKMAEMQPFVMGNNQTTDFWGSQFLHNYPDQDFNLETSILSESALATQFTYSAEACLPSTISPVSSCSRLAEDFFIDGLDENRSNLSYFSSPLHSMNYAYSGVQDMTQQNLEREMSSYINQPSIGFEGCNTMAFPLICRQASDAELEVSLWLQEDSSLLVGI